MKLEQPVSEMILVKSAKVSCKKMARNASEGFLSQAVRRPCTAQLLRFEIEESVYRYLSISQ